MVEVLLPPNQTIIGKKSWLNDIEEFRGIPYGQVPGRWQHSTLRTTLPCSPYDATANGPRCPQPAGPNNTNTFQSHLDFPLDVQESEFDCLTLLIVRPSPEALTGRVARLPVFVWIHGGGYGFGASTDPMWDPTRLVARALEVGKPIIAVSINYRLNVFGFAASTEIIDAQSKDSFRGANFGLGDQRIAMEWIARNIEHFGGDPSKVTIGGQSAGSSSVHAHVIEAKLGHDRPLFRKATIQSGAVGTLGPIPISKAESNFEALCAHLGVSDLRGSERITALSKLPSSQLLKGTEALGWWVFPIVNDNLTVKPCTTGRWSVHLSRNATECGHSDNQPENSINVMIGDTDTEGSIWYDQISKITDMQQIEPFFKTHLSPPHLETVLSTFGLSTGISVPALQARLAQLLTDVEFGYPVHLAREELSAKLSSNGNSVRSTSTQSYRIRFGNPWPGIHHGIAHHCVELIYLFDCFHDDILKADAVEEHGRISNLSLVERLQGLWVDFIVDDAPAHFSESEALIFESDRTTRLESMDGSEWIERRQRFEVLQQYEKEMHVITRQIMGITVA